MDDKDIWRTARLLIDQQGEDAALHAAQMADELLEKGDIEGQSVWMRVLKAIESFQEKQTDQTMH